MSEKKDLTELPIRRQNILNSSYVVAQANEEIGLRGVSFQNETYVTKKAVCDFYDVSERTLEDCIQTNGDELSRNGYVTLRGSDLRRFAAEFEKTTGETLSKTIPKLGIFSFRAFLNVGMLLKGSERAAEVRCKLLDIAISEVDKRTSGSSLYVNRRERDFIPRAAKEIGYRKRFTDALRDYVDAGPFKYAVFTNKIYQSIFREKAREYRELLSLPENIDIRHSLYSSVLLVVSVYENGLANLFERESQRKGRKLSYREADDCFSIFEQDCVLMPMIEDAREKMASRDYAFRQVFHDKLAEYLREVSPEEYEALLGEQSVDLHEESRRIPKEMFEAGLDGARESMLRLKAS